MPAKRHRRGSQRGDPPRHTPSGRDSPELETLRAGMALHVIEEAADLLADHYARHYAADFSPARCRRLLLRSAEIVLTHEASRG